MYKWALREVEMWVLSAGPRQPEEKKKYHGTIRAIEDMIVASSHILSLSPKGDTQWVYDNRWAMSELRQAQVDR